MHTHLRTHTQSLPPPTHTCSCVFISCISLLKAAVSPFKADVSPFKASFKAEVSSFKAAVSPFKADVSPFNSSLTAAASALSSAALAVTCRWIRGENSSLSAICSGVEVREGGVGCWGKGEREGARRLNTHASTYTRPHKHTHTHTPPNTPPPHPPPTRWCSAPARAQLSRPATCQRCKQARNCDICSKVAQSHIQL